MLDKEQDRVKVDLAKLYPGIDLAETLSCVTGKWHPAHHPRDGRISGRHFCQPDRSQLGRWSSRWCGGSMKKLQTLLDDIDFDNLPPAWTTFDLGRFSKTKALWDYQKEALQNALKALWKYYQRTRSRFAKKQAFFAWYADNQIHLERSFAGQEARQRRLACPLLPDRRSPDPSTSISSTAWASGWRPARARRW